MMVEQFDKAYIRELAHKWKAGTLSEQERKQLESWDRSQPDGILRLEENSDPNEILNRLLVKVSTEIKRERAEQNKEIKLWPRIAKVAAAVAFIISGVYFFNYNKSNTDKNKSLVAQDVAPGKVGATLTLASGKTIRLADAVNGELANEAGISINKTANGQLVYEIKGSDADPNKINTLSTAKGETYQVRLPDGSMVYLNAASSLTYAASLVERGKRMVRLRGEGYFEIAKDTRHPFIVQTKGQVVEVLGTHFNINAYQEEPSSKTTLAEGSVKVTAMGKSLVLKPNQQSILSNGSLSMKEVDAELALAWKSGFFLFDRESLESVMVKLARWYDVKVVYNDPSLKAKTFTGTISRFEKISQVFSMLERTEVAKFKIDSKTITIDKMK